VEVVLRLFSVDFVCSVGVP
jgi:hypothetical protein